MKLITYQAKKFSWTPYSKTLPDALEGKPGHAEEAVVVWIHAEAKDEARLSRVRRHCLKHIKWVANKKSLRNIVLHSFAHLGGENSSEAFAKSLLDQLQQRLESTGYNVQQTPFGWFCSWELNVYGPSMAKIFKEI